MYAQLRIYLKCFVPAASDHDTVVRRLYPVDRLNGGSMLGHVYGLVRLEVPQLACLVT